jgi:hypothetical protein
VTDRPVTPFAAFESPPKPATLPPAAETHIPGPPKLPREAAAETLPEPDPLVELGSRVAALSDELNDPDGLMARRHNSVMSALDTLTRMARDIASEQIKINDRLNKLEPAVEDNTAALRLVKSMGSNGNGADHS